MQSEDDFSLSGVPITALCFDEKAQFLVSGDKNGMVRILIDLLRYAKSKRSSFNHYFSFIYLYNLQVRVIKFKPEPYNLGNCFASLQR